MASPLAFARFLVSRRAIVYNVRTMTLVYLLVAALLIALNAFFVLAELAAVKVRATRVEEMVAQGDARARVVQHVQAHLDEYLSVCQVGITFASIGLGFVGEPAFARLIERGMRWAGGAARPVSHGLAVAIAYLLVSFLHVVCGELVPKRMAIRKPEHLALWSAPFLRFFRVVFAAPIFALNHTATALLRLLGVPPKLEDAHHSEEELRILLEESQSKGLMSFRRLLLMENVFDLGDVLVRDAMRIRQGVRTLRTDLPWEENLKVIRESRFSRFPLVEPDSDYPLGIVHVKDLLYRAGPEMRSMDLRGMVRPYVHTLEDTPIESLLADLQRRRGHVALVFDRGGRWTGFITLEDIIEEVIGTVEDEFELEPPLHLADTLSMGRIVLGVQAATIEEAVRHILARIPQAELPAPAMIIEKAVVERERTMSTYLGRALAIPHARLEGLERPVLLFGRAEEGIPIRGHQDRARLIFVLLTPLVNPRVQARLLARIAGLLSSEYVEARLLEAGSPTSVLEAIRVADPVALG